MGEGYSSWQFQMGEGYARWEETIPDYVREEANKDVNHLLWRVHLKLTEDVNRGTQRANWVVKKV